MKKWKMGSLIAVFILLLSSGIALLAGGGIFGFAKNPDVNIEKNEDVNGVPFLGVTITNIKAYDTNGNQLSGSFDACKAPYKTSQRDGLDGSGNKYTIYSKTVTMPTDYSPTLSGYILKTKSYKYKGTAYDWTHSQSVSSTLSQFDAQFNPDDFEIILTYELPVPVFTITYHPNGGSGTSVTQNVAKGDSFTVKSADTFTRTGYTLSSWNENSSGTAYGYTCGSTQTMTANKNLTFYAIWTVNSYTLDVKGLLDGTLSETLGSYATFDVYINATRVAYQVNDYCEYVRYNESYLITNINYATDKVLVNVYHDDACTISGGVGGTMPAENRIVCLKLRTKTWNDYAASSFASGSGTAASPYIIKTAEQLAKVAKDSRSSNLRDKYYKLGADIDLSAHVWEGIGSEDSSLWFGGNIDGDFHQIKNIKTSVDSFILKDAGLVARSAGAYITSIIMKDGNVQGTRDTGPIIGGNDGGYRRSTVTKCIVDNLSISSNSNQSVGGIAGRGTSGNYVACLVRNSTMAVIGGEGTAAGICGWRGKVTDCAAINCNITSAGWDTTGRELGGYTSSTNDSAETQVNSSYGDLTIKGTRKKVMFGDDIYAWGNWGYSESMNINNGYPVQKSLFHIVNQPSGFTSAGIYYYLKNTLGFTVI